MDARMQIAVLLDGSREQREIDGLAAVGGAV